jgi:hypothetical protein
LTAADRPTLRILAGEGHGQTYAVARNTTTTVRVAMPWERAPLMQREPSTVISLLTAALTALLGVGAAFGLDVDEAQRNAILAAVGPLVLVIAALGPIIRAFVVSPQTAANAVVMAKQETPTDNTVPQVNVAGGAYAAAVKEMGFVTTPPPAG